MIVKILRKSKTFNAVRYNTRKVAQEKGILVKASGFDALNGLSRILPEDYTNYFKALAARNGRVIFPQFHAVISAKGRSSTLDDLKNLAVNWLREMGYSEQPYLLIFHNDTRNNHIHMVSCRVNRQGKKISDRFEKVRAYKVLNQLLGQDASKQVAAKIQAALRYNFSTVAQFQLLLERSGYQITRTDDQIKISKFGKVIDHVSIRQLEEKIADHQVPKERVAKLKAIFSKYLALADRAIKPVLERKMGDQLGKVVAYRSELSQLLSTTFGIEFVFHFKDGKLPYGYTILDHASKQVFKGSTIMPLSHFIGGQLNTAYEKEIAGSDLVNQTPIEENFTVEEDGTVADGYDQTINPEIGVPEIYIADDLDDEAILGRNRRRQKKSRTNTR